MENNKQQEEDNNNIHLTCEILRAWEILKNLLDIFQDNQYHNEKAKLGTLKNVFETIQDNFFDFNKQQEYFMVDFMTAFTSKHSIDLNHLQRTIFDLLRDPSLQKEQLLMDFIEIFISNKFFDAYQTEEIRTMMRLQHLIARKQEEEEFKVEEFVVNPIPEKVLNTVHEKVRLENYKVENGMLEEAKDWRDKLNQEIDKQFSELTPQQEEMDQLNNAYQIFKSIVDQVMKKNQYQYELVIYGSSANGLALRSNNSDLDLSLVIYNQVDEEKPVLHERILSEIILTIRQNRRHNEEFNCKPIIVATFGKQLSLTYLPYEISIEVFVNKVVDPYNTWLLQTYAMLDERFLKLALILKAWNKKVNLDMGTNKLNSYSMILMLIAYLQFEKVLPCLQKIGVDDKDPKKTEKIVKYDKFIYDQKVFKYHAECYANVYFANDFELIKKEFGKQQNVILTPAELLHGFFQFYSEKFDIKTHVISIAHSHPFLTKHKYMLELKQTFKDEKYALFRDKMLKHIHFWAFTAVDPFDRTYNPSKQITTKTEERDESSYQRKFKYYYKLIEAFGSIDN